MDDRCASIRVGHCGPRGAATCSGYSSAAPRLRLAAIAATILAIAGMAIAPATSAKDASSAGHWVGTWSASPQAAYHPLELNGQTVRQTVHVSIGGTRVRVRLSNAYGAEFTAHWRGARGPAQHGAIDRRRLGPGADLQRVGVHDDSCRRIGDQRSRKSAGARPRRPGGQYLHSRQCNRGDRTFAGVADDLYLAGRRFQRCRLAADGDHDAVLLFSDGRRSGRLPRVPVRSSRSATRSPMGCTRPRTPTSAGRIAWPSGCARAKAVARSRCSTRASAATDFCTIR